MCSTIITTLFDNQL